MSQRDLLIRELKQWVMPLDGNQSRTTSADTISSEVLNGLRCILVEIEEASVLIAITASIAGALAESRAAGLNLKHLTSYMPPSPELYRKHIDAVLSAALSPSLVLPIQAYHARLSYALRLTRAIVEAGPAPTDAIRTAEIEKVEDAWRHVCGTALGAIAILRETLASVRYSRPPVNNEHAEALLRSAKAGGRPCVGDDGKVQMPRWAESRAHKRQPTENTARVAIAGGVQEVVIENASRTGLGLSGIKGAAPGMPVAVNLEDGQRLAGKIMWVREERAGVQLIDMLPASHVLLGVQGSKR